MTHFAEIDENNIVIRVLVINQDEIDSGVWGNPNKWIRTSYNTHGGIHYKPNSNIPSDIQTKSLRKNFAGIGFTYDEGRDAFISPKPFNSWILNEETCCWESPIPCPNDDKVYSWNEETQEWDPYG